MIITIDVGNTNITVGVFNGDEIVASFRMTTKMPRTSDEYGMLLTNLLEQNRIHCDEIQDAIIASVVPNVMHSLEGAVIKYLNIRPIVIEPGTKTGIRIVTENPRQIGADRIVDAAAAYEIYGGPVLVLDFGTATTYDLVDATGAFVSGVTAPGIRISAKALRIRKTNRQNLKGPPYHDVQESFRRCRLRPCHRRLRRQRHGSRHVARRHRTHVRAVRIPRHEDPGVLRLRHRPHQGRRRQGRLRRQGHEHGL